ncbi:hypothetical protein SAMN05444362_1431, partial [Dysgonomonas macrotermitis]
YFYNHGRIVQNKASIGTDPYGKPAQVFLYEGSMEEMAGYMGRMLKNDLQSNLNLDLYNGHAIAQKQQEPQAAILSNEDVKKEVAGNDLGYSGQDKSKYPDDLDPFWQAIEDHWFPNEKEPLNKEKENIIKVEPSENASDAESRDILFDDKPQSVTRETLEVDISAQPVMSLYDLFGFTQEERTQVKPARSKKKRNSPLNPPRGTSIPSSPKGKDNLQNTQASLNSPEKDIKGPSSGGVGEANSFEPRPYSGELFEFHKKGSLVEDNGQVGFLKERYRDDAEFQALDVAFDQRAKISRYIEIRDTYHTLYNHEAEHLTEHASLRGNLNLCYDNFVKRYGYLNDKKNLDVIKMDAGGREMLSLETPLPSPLQKEREQVLPMRGLGKADIFFHPVAFNPNEISVANTSDEALIASLNKYGEVRLDYMESLLSGKNREEIVSELQGRIYFNPLIQNYEVQDRFIAGNVVEKAEAIERYLQNHPDDIPAQESLKALQEATPQPIRYEELDFNFGERWIDTSVYEDYMGKLFETDVNISYYASRDDFTVKADKSNMIINEKFAVQGENRLYTGMHLLKHSLLNT